MEKFSFQWSLEGDISISANSVEEARVIAEDILMNYTTMSISVNARGLRIVPKQ